MIKKKFIFLLGSKRYPILGAWELSDSAADTTVVGSRLDGVLVGGNTEDVYELLDGNDTFHLDGATQYVKIDFLHIQPIANHIQPSEIGSLWTKYASNPVLSEAPDSAKYGQLVKNPLGGWYFFGSINQTDIYRWQSTDLFTWTDKTAILLGVPGAWDAKLGVASVFQKPSDNSWVMLYRGFNGTTTFKIGLATSVDGTTFTRKDNGGVDDGLFPQFGNNYDPVGVILVGTTYFVYVNGSPTHGDQHVYTSTDDFATFSAYAGNPIFKNGTGANGYFCPGVFLYAGYYYLLICVDLNVVGSALYDHGIALYRSTSPYFEADNRDYLGYVIVNDQVYDAPYLDTPSIPREDVYGEPAAEFGDNLHMLYTSNATQSIASTTLSELASRSATIDLQSLIQSLVVGVKRTFSFHVQFDSLTDGDAVFSVGGTPTDTNPVWLCVVRTSGADKVLSLLLGGGYRLTSQPLAINTPYYVKVEENLTDRKVYVDDILVGTFTQSNVAADSNYLYIGNGYGGNTLDGHVWDFRIYEQD